MVLVAIPGAWHKWGDVKVEGECFFEEGGLDFLYENLNCHVHEVNRGASLHKWPSKATTYNYFFVRQPNPLGQSLGLDCGPRWLGRL